MLLSIFYRNLLHLYTWRVPGGRLPWWRIGDLAKYGELVRITTVIRIHTPTRDSVSGGMNIHDTPSLEDKYAGPNAWGCKDEKTWYSQWRANPRIKNNSVTNLRQDSCSITLNANTLSRRNNKTLTLHDQQQHCESSDREQTARTLGTRRESSNAYNHLWILSDYLKYSYLINLCGIRVLSIQTMILI